MKLDAPRVVMSLVALIGVGAAWALVARRMSRPHARAGIVGDLPDVPGLREREAKEPGFAAMLLQVAQDGGVNPDHLAALISHESGFNPQAHNPTGGALGLIQWLPAYMGAVGTDPMSLGAMSATEQLEVVAKTIKVWGGAAKDIAIAGYMPGLAGKPDDYVSAKSGEKAYEWNKALDHGGKGYITLGDVRSDVYASLERAKSKPRVAVGQ
jgi:hypothetical protein